MQKFKKTTENYKSRNNQVESIDIFNFEFNSQNIGQTKQNFVGMSVAASPALRNFDLHEHAGRAHYFYHVCL